MANSAIPYPAIPHYRPDSNSAVLPSELSSGPDQSIIDKINNNLRRHRYDRIEPLLQRLTDTNTQYTANPCISTPLGIIESLRNAELEIVFQCHRSSLSVQWEDFINMTSNLPADSGIPYNMDIGSCLISYYQLARTPFNINTNNHGFSYYPHRHRRFNYLLEPIDDLDHDELIHRMYQLRFTSSLMELDLNDIELMTPDNKRDLHLAAKTLGETYYLRLLQRTGYIQNVPQHQLFNGLMKSIAWIPGSRSFILGKIRFDYNNEELYTDSIFDQCWKKLTPEQIIDKEFNPDHLQRIGVVIPHIDLALEDITKTNILTVKRLIPHSDPSDHIIKNIVVNLDNSNDCKHIEIVILLVRYKRTLMMKCISHSFVRRLINMSVENGVML